MLSTQVCFEAIFSCLSFGPPPPPIPELSLFKETLSNSHSLSLVCQCGIVLQNKETSQQAIIIASGTQNAQFPLGGWKTQT